MHTQQPTLLLCPCCRLHLQDARLRGMEDSLRADLRKESLGHLRDVASVFVQQLTRNKLAHAEVQTYNPVRVVGPSHEIGVQAQPAAAASPHLRSALAGHSRRGSSPGPPLSQQVSLQAPASARRHSTATSQVISEGYSEDFEEDGYGSVYGTCGHGGIGAGHAECAPIGRPPLPDRQVHPGMLHLLV